MWKMIKMTVMMEMKLDAEMEGEKNSSKKRQRSEIKRSVVNWLVRSENE